MDVSKVTPALPDLQNKKGKQLVHNQHQIVPSQPSFKKQESYQDAYEQFERIEKTDISLYQEVEQYPERLRARQLFSFSIRV